ncbi:hypothetical protein GCM10011386_46880 [Parapedobacter defluvii]|uniref:DUF2207 domain-containing protein n=1 Tax=Parapedobacter defluvii TaxID=2045106 RepID=A0ABQ1N232_9SPHI|nr:DUF2207 domain-containing protein [Parapedobacter defluvii]GGC49213.1 hypothetical protein GCM10011386_46880 [Parapedobacter defluvii]
MKKFLLILLLSLANVVAFAQGFVVNQFTADVYLNKDGYFDVAENYEVNFTDSKHGIFREIVTDYRLQTTDGKTEKRHLVIKI